MKVPFTIAFKNQLYNYSVYVGWCNFFVLCQPSRCHDVGQAARFWYRFLRS